MHTNTSAVIRGDVEFEVNTQGEGDHRIASVTFGRYGRGSITLQGNPTDMVALVDRLRNDMITAISSAWPTIEEKHQALGICPLDGLTHSIEDAVAINGAVTA